MYTGKKVLVTGADGFIGSHLVEELVKNNANVTALSLYNSFDSYGWLDDIDSHTRNSINIVSGDIRDNSFVSNLVKGKDIVFHLAALISIPFSYKSVDSFVQTNISGSINVFESSKIHNVERVIHTSTSEVYGTAITTPISEDHPYQGQSPYSASNIGADMMADSYARCFSLPVVILRPFNTYGPRQSERAVISSAIRQILDPRCDEIHLGSTKPKRDFNYVSDTVSAFILAGVNSGFDYGVPHNIGTGTSISISEMIECLLKLTGSKKAIKTDEDRFRPEKSEVFELIASTDRFRQIVNWEPKIKLEDGLKLTIDWWKNQIKDKKVRAYSSYSF